MISNISGSSAYSGMQRPDPAQMADKMFSKLDTAGKGYIDKTDLQAALDQTSSSGNSGNTPSADEILKKLDGNGDGKVTKQEMSDSINKLVNELNSQLNSSQSGAKSAAQSAGGSPPAGGPPPGAASGGSASANGSSASSSATSSSSSSKTYDPADTNQDGKVSMQEQIAYAISQAAKPSSKSSSETQNVNSDAAVMKRLMDMLKTYGDNNQSSTQSGNANSLSVMA